MAGLGLFLAGYGRDGGIGQKIWRDCGIGRKAGPGFHQKIERDGGIDPKFERDCGIWKSSGIGILKMPWRDTEFLLYLDRDAGCTCSFSNFLTTTSYCYW